MRDLYTEQCGFAGFRVNTDSYITALSAWCGRLGRAAGPGQGRAARGVVVLPADRVLFGQATPADPAGWVVPGWGSEKWGRKNFGA